METENQMSGGLEHHMEINFESREISVYREFLHTSRRTQESVECVVPDTDADIEKIAAVQSEVFLKSKDLSARGVIVSGELSANVLYIREGQTGLSGLSLRKPFSLEFEAEGLESESLAQITLLIQGTDVRALNPRKLSVVFDVEGELSAYRAERLRTETALPKDSPGLHALTEEHSLLLPNAVCEKSLAVNEQFPFTDGKAVPAALLSEKAELVISDCQLIGSKVIVKGSAELSVCALSAERDEPCLYAFSAPFSQIVDVGIESMNCCTVRPEITGAYYDLVDTINGEKVLDMELHAVLQLVCSERQNLRLISDVYSNLMPAELLVQTRSLELASPLLRKRLSTEEKIGLMEECREILCVLVSPTRISADAGKLTGAVNLDILFRNVEGKLSAGRRTLTLEQPTEGAPLRILTARVTQMSARPDGENAECSLTMELGCLAGEKTELRNIEGVILDEDAPYIQESLPTLTLVRAGGESLWALARRYHSSVEKIRESNEDAENTTRMLLIPKCL